MNKTYMAKKGEFKAQWVVVDASDKILGRLATGIAEILMGKHRPEYTPHVDTGDFVIVLNATKVKVTGAKFTQRTYEHYTKYPGGRRVITMDKMMDQKPGKIIEEAVRRMLPKTKLGRAMLGKLKVYPGAEHPHQAQNPQKKAI